MFGSLNFNLVYLNFSLGYVWFSKIYDEKCEKRKIKRKNQMREKVNKK